MSEWVRLVNNWVRSVNNWVKTVSNWVRVVNNWVKFMVFTILISNVQHASFAFSFPVRLHVRLFVTFIYSSTVFCQIA